MKSMNISKREAQILTEMEEREMIIFSATDVKRFLNISRLNTHGILARMMKKELIERLERDRYITRDNWDSLDIYEIVSSMQLPAYLAYYSALHFHGLTTQVPRTVYMAATVRKRNMTIRGQKIKFVKIGDSMFFGYQRYGNIIASDPEKTIIDCLQHPLYGGGIGNVEEALSSTLDLNTLVDYCIRTESSALASRLGYLLEKNGLLLREDELLSQIGSYSKLKPGTDSKNLIPKWKIYVDGGI